MDTTLSTSSAPPSSAGGHNKETSVYVGNLDDRCTETLLYELFLQMGPVARAHIPRDRLTQVQQAFGFVEFTSPVDADYACKCLSGVKLFGRPLKVMRMNQSSEERLLLDVGANLFVGNLDASIDERTLQETFSVFGRVIDCKVARDLETGVPKGYGFVSFDAFEASDAAIDSMHGQYLGNKPVSIGYAYKRSTSNKDSSAAVGSGGERHGTPQERQFAQEARRLRQLQQQQQPPAP